MTATVHQIPTAAAARSGLNMDQDAASGDSPTLSEDHIRRLTGGAKRPCDQLRILHALGYVRAWRLPTGGRVILERAHVDAVQRGQFGQAAANEPAAPRAKPNRAAFLAQFGAKAGG